MSHGGDQGKRESGLGCDAVEFTARFTQLTSGLVETPTLAKLALHVLIGLPVEVQRDFLDDPTFQIALEQLDSKRRSTLFMACPTGRNVSRCVILRRKLESASDLFALYVIAHEFAHAYLRNGGWGQINDRELAADQLAASWGYPSPF